MTGQGGNISEDDDFHAGSGNGDVHTTKVTQETYLSVVIRAYHGEDDDISLLSLETVHGIDTDLATEGLEELTFHQQPTEVLYLGTIG